MTTPVVPPRPDSAATSGDAGRVLVRNTALNLAGLGLPLVVALFAYRIFYDQLGEETFGALQLVQLIAGLTLFDVGLSRALTQLVSRALAADEETDLPALIWTSIVIMGTLGLGGWAICQLAAPALVEALDVSPALHEEAILAFRVAGIAFVFIGIVSGLRGVMEAHLRFDVTNLLRAPFGALLYLAPLAVVPLSTRLVHLSLAIVLTRAASCVVHFIACRRVMPELARIALTRSRLGELLRFGGWMTVSNLVSPLMVSLDRFIIGVLFSVAVVPFYAVPYDLVTRLLIAASAMSSVLFPQIARAFATEPTAAAALLRRAASYLGVVLFPLVALVILFAEEGLTLWMGAAFAAKSLSLLQILAVGVLLNAFGHLPFAFVQAAGRPDLTAKLHLVELPMYVALLLLLSQWIGLEGVAIAWGLRAAIDTCLLYAVTWRTLPTAYPGHGSIALLIAFIIAAGMLITIAPGLMVRVAIGIPVVAVSSVLARAAALQWRQRGAEVH